MVLAPYLADTEKARLLQPDGTYARAHKARGNSRSWNGTRFSVQGFLMGLSEGRGVGEEALGLAPILKQQSSPKFEILLKNWNRANEA
jgi:hypothetical protein